MPQITINCPHCSQPLSVQSEWAGQSMECPYCKQNFVVPVNNPGGYPGNVPGGYPGNNPGGYPGNVPGGYPGNNPWEKPAPGNGLAICALIFSILFALVGLILSIIGVCKYPAGTNGKVMSIIGLIISIINMVLGLVLFS